MNIDFLKKILMSEDDYWVVAKRNNSSHVIYEKFKDDIIFIAIDRKIVRNLKYEEVTLLQLEKLQGSYIDLNIFLNQPYAPFQIGTSFYNIYEGFPITSDKIEFLKEALALDSDSIWDYKKLIKEKIKKTI